jgi:membrane-bound lytic murein transglycosylase B
MNYSTLLLTLTIFTCACALALSSRETYAQSTEFSTCVAGLKTRALDEGLDHAAVEEIFGVIEELPGVIKSDRSQPEFVQTFEEYYALRVTQGRVDTGRELLARHHGLLSQVSAETGIPAQYLVAFWGLETNFGSYLGKLSIPSALATLACDPRRGKFFADQLFAATRIVASGDLTAAGMQGSWAGAMGHMQFMPTTYIAHARDGDNDGRRDLLGSIDDAMASAAHYLAAMGWQRGYKWGREVYLPDGFDYAQAGTQNWQPLSTWRDLGVTDTSGRVVADLDIQSAVVLPSGHLGPAFLVYPNFRIIMKWNRSEAYAIAVGRLADRIAGAGVLHRPHPPAEEVKFTSVQIKQMQAQLNALGYDSGKPDGVIGSGTRRAVRTFQKDHGLIADGYPSNTLFSFINAKANS